MGCWVAQPSRPPLPVSLTFSTCSDAPRRPQGASSASPAVAPATQAQCPPQHRPPIFRQQPPGSSPFTELSPAGASLVKPSPRLIGVSWELRPVGRGACPPAQILLPPLPRGVSRSTSRPRFLSERWDRCHSTRWQEARAGRVKCLECPRERLPVVLRSWDWHSLPLTPFLFLPHLSFPSLKLQLTKKHIFSAPAL